jgi:hypothetical protein
MMFIALYKPAKESRITTPSLPEISDYLLPGATFAT